MLIFQAHTTFSSTSVTQEVGYSLAWSLCVSDSVYLTRLLEDFNLPNRKYLTRAREALVSPMNMFIFKETHVFT